MHTEWRLPLICHSLDELLAFLVSGDIGVSAVIGTGMSVNVYVTLAATLTGTRRSLVLRLRTRVLYCEVEDAKAGCGDTV